MEGMKVGEIFNKFYAELAVTSKVPDTGNSEFILTLKIWKMVVHQNY